MPTIYYAVVDYGVTPRSEYQCTQQFDFTLHEIQSFETSMLCFSKEMNYEERQCTIERYLELLIAEMVEKNPSLKDTIEFAELSGEHFDKVAQRLLMEAAHPQAINPPFIVTSHEDLLSATGMTKLTYFFRSIAESDTVNIVVKSPLAAFGEGNFFFSFHIEKTAEFITSLQQEPWAHQFHAQPRAYYIIEKQVGYYKDSRYQALFGNTSICLSHRALIFYYIHQEKAHFFYQPIYKRYRNNINSHETINQPSLTKQYLINAALRSTMDGKETMYDIPEPAHDNPPYDTYYKKLSNKLLLIANALYKYKMKLHYTKQEHQVWVTGYYQYFRHHIKNAPPITVNCDGILPRPKDNSVYLLLKLFGIILQHLPESVQWHPLRKRITQIITYSLIYTTNRQVLQIFFLACFEYARSISQICLEEVKNRAIADTENHFIIKAIEHIESSAETDTVEELLIKETFFSQSFTYRDLLISHVSDR